MRCWAGMGLGADLDYKSMDRDVCGGHVRAGFCLQMGPGVHRRGILRRRLEHTQHSPHSSGPDSCPRTLREEWQLNAPLPANTWWKGKAPPQSLNPVAQTRQIPMLNPYHGEKMLPGCTPPPDSGAQTDPSPSPAPLLAREKQPPTQHPAVPAPDTAPPRPGARARRAHAPSRLTPRHLHKQGAKHPRAHAPGTRRHHRAASHKGWRARGNTQPRAGTLAVPSPRQAPTAAHLHPCAPGTLWGPPLPATSSVGVRCRPPPTHRPLRCGDLRLQHPLPPRGPDRPQLPSFSSRPTHLAQVRRPPRPRPADTHLSSAALGSALRFCPVAPRTRAPRPAHLPEPGRGGNG